jgi:hypothetical protein
MAMAADAAGSILRLNLESRAGVIWRGPLGIAVGGPVQVAGCKPCWMVVVIVG